MEISSVGDAGVEEEGEHGCRKVRTSEAQSVCTLTVLIEVEARNGKCLGLTGEHRRAATTAVSGDTDLHGELVWYGGSGWLEAPDNCRTTPEGARPRTVPLCTCRSRGTCSVADSFLIVGLKGTERRLYPGSPTGGRARYGGSGVEGVLGEGGKARGLDGDGENTGRGGGATALFPMDAGAME